MDHPADTLMQVPPEISRSWPAPLPPGTPGPRSVLVLTTIAFGGRGGIAEHNRHLLRALARMPGTERIDVLTRVPSDGTEEIPAPLTFRDDAAGPKHRFATALARRMAGPRPDVVLCAHLNLLPMGALAAARWGAPLALIVHGVEAWPAPDALRQRLMARVDRLVAVSQFTLDGMQHWARLPDVRRVVAPNTVDLSAYTPGPKRADLLERYGLTGRRVVLTVGRMSVYEQYKGHDEILAVLPALAERVPDVAWLVVGDGDDRPRLEQKTRDLGLEDRVVFAGYVPEAEKVDHVRLADVFAMPGRGEGFGIVYLEAMACGVPAIASTADASREAVLGGALGHMVDPDRPEELLDVLTARLLPAPGGARATVTPEVVGLVAPEDRLAPEALDTFRIGAFDARWHAIMTDLAGLRRG